MEKQSLVHDTKETTKEAQIMQSLTHQNISTIIGVQLQKEPISFIMDFKWEQDTSVTIRKLLSCDKNSVLLKNVQNSLTRNDWLIISHDLTDVLSRIFI